MLMFLVFPARAQDSPALHQTAIAAPKPPTAPMVPAVHMGQSAKAAAAQDNPLGSLGGLLMGQLQQGAAPAPPPAAEKQTVDPAARNADFSELLTADTAQVAQVLDPSRIRLTDGRILQLAGIDMPDYDPYDPGPISLAARNVLKPLLEGQRVRLHVTKNPANGRITRLGDQLAQLDLPQTGVWAQGVLLVQGLARIRPSQRNPEMAAQMIRLEDQARIGRRGLWSDAKYALQTPATAWRSLNDWGVVQGVVFGAALNRNIVYLNFGPDRNKDFTVAIGSDVRRELEKRNINPLALAGKTIRVRGWLRSYNGPFLELDNAVWLESVPENNSRLP